MPNLYITVQNALVDIVNDFADAADPGFQEITYSEVGRASLKMSLEPAPLPITQLPGSVRANEVAETFTDDERHGRTRNRISDSWSWQIHVKFSRPVELQGFKDTVKENFSIPRCGDTPEVFLDFVDMAYAHPVEVQGSSTGSEFLATVNAKIIRRV